MCEGISSGDDGHHHVVGTAPHGQWQRLTSTTTAGTPIASSALPAPSADTGNCDLGEKRKHHVGDDLKKPAAKMETTTDPCFPGCLDDTSTTGASNQKEVRVVDAEILASETKTSNVMGDSDAPTATPSSGRRSRRNSRRMSSGNQYEPLVTGGAHFDLEDVARGVLSPVNYSSLPKPPGSIVVDYDEGMPERSRTELLKDVNADGSVAVATDAGDCAPEACNPLEGLAFEELTIEDTRIPRSRLGSSSQPKTPSRRGKSVMPSTVVEVAKVVKTSSVVVEKQTKMEPEETLERCSSIHKLCLCEVRLHKSRESCWLVAKDSVYDVTGLVDSHPAGPRSILRKAGGTDCTRDMKFHSKAARKMLEKCFIGKLVPCGEDPAEADGPAACTIM